LGSLRLSRGWLSDGTIIRIDNTCRDTDEMKQAQALVAMELAAYDAIPHPVFFF
jgi:hypothetical protein